MFNPHSIVRLLVNLIDICFKGGGLNKKSHKLDDMQEERACAFSNGV